MFLRRFLGGLFCYFVITNAIALPVFNSVPSKNTIIPFNSDAVGTPVSQTIRISNTGADPLQINSAIFGLTNPSNFSISTNPPPFTIPANSSASMTIKCSPDMGSFLTYANLNITTNDPNNPSVYYTTECIRHSTGVLYESYPAKGTPIDFKDTNINTAQTRSVRIFNAGDTPMSISSLSFSGGNAANFNITLNPATTLNAGASTYFVMTCTPNQSGLLQTNLVITTNASNVTSIVYPLNCRGIGNSPPSNILLDNLSVNGGLATNSFVANISTVDPDVSDTHTYTLSNTPSMFLIKGNQLWTSQTMPLATNSPYIATIKSTDSGGLSLEKTFNINVIPKVGARFSSKPYPNQLLDLGKTLVLTPTLGQTNTGQLEIIETGDLELQVSPTIVGVNAGDFKVSPSSMVLPDGSSSQFFTVECKPAAKGIRSATLELSTNSASSPAIFSYPLQCEGIENVILTSNPPPNALLDIGKTPLRQPISKGLEITKNGGTTELKISATITGASAGDFKVSPPEMVLPTNSPPQSFSIECSPLTIGLKNATLELSTNDPNLPIFSYPLQCEGQTQNMFVSEPPSNSIVLFNSDELGTPVSQTIYITNHADQDLTIELAEITGGLYAETFQIINGIAPFTIAKQTISVPFPLMLQCTPANELLQGGFLHLKTNDPNNLDVIYPLACLKRSAGAIYASLPRLSEGIRFGNVAIGNNENRKLIMFNVGDQPISISNVTISGIKADAFKTNAVLPITIQSGNFQAIDVNCQPLQNGIYLGTLSISSNASVARRVSLPTIGTNPPQISYPLTCRSGLNNPPTDISLTNQILKQNMTANTLIADISSIDPDIDDSQTYILQDNSGLFEIRGTQLWTKQPLPANSTNFDIRIKSIDSGDLFIEKVFHLTVENVFQHFLAEVVTSEGVKTTVDETEIITAKGFVQPLPEHINQVGDIFVIYRYISPSNNTIELPPITLLRNTSLQANNELLLYQGRLIYLAGTFEIVLGYRVNGIENSGLATTFRVQKNSPPHDLSLSRNTIVERSAVGTVVGTLVAQDVNKNDFFRYIITKNAGEPFGYFKIVGDQLQIADSFPLNYASNATLQVGIRAIDGAGGFIDKTFSIEVIENTAPHIGGEIRSNGLAIRGTKDQFATLMQAQIFTLNAWIQPPSIHLGKVADIHYKVVYTPLEGEQQLFEGIWAKDKMLSSVLDIEMVRDFSLNLMGTFEVSIGYRLKDGSFEILTPFQTFRIQG